MNRVAAGALMTALAACLGQGDGNAEPSHRDVAKRPIYARFR